MPPLHQPPQLNLFLLFPSGILCSVAQGRATWAPDTMFSEKGDGTVFLESLLSLWLASLGGSVRSVEGRSPDAALRGSPQVTRVRLEHGHKLLAGRLSTLFIYPTLGRARDPCAHVSVCISWVVCKGSWG